MSSVRSASCMFVVALLTACGGEDRSSGEFRIANDERTFEFYECTVADQRAFIRVDVGLFEAGPDRSRPNNLWVRVQFRHPTELGLSSRKEFEPLSKFEDALQEAVTPSPLVGVLTNAGARSWYFYTDDLQRDSDRAMEVAKNLLPQYEVEAAGFEDPEWEQYFKFLYPNDLGWQYIQDARTLRSLRAEGDDGETPREIRHWAHFASAADQARFAKEVAALGYMVHYVGRADDGERPFVVQFKYAEPLAPVHIFRLSEKLHMLATDCGGEYDGWETKVVKAERDEDE